VPVGRQAGGACAASYGHTQHRPPRQLAHAQPVPLCADPGDAPYGGGFAPAGQLPAVRPPVHRLSRPVCNAATQPVDVGVSRPAGRSCGSFELPYSLPVTYVIPYQLLILRAFVSTATSCSAHRRSRCRCILTTQ